MKTVELLKRANKTIDDQKEILRENDHVIKKQKNKITEITADAQIRDAQIRSAEMFICYLQNIISPDEDIRIPLKDLYEFAGTHTVEWQPEEDAIVIKTHKKIQQI